MSDPWSKTVGNGDNAVTLTHHEFDDNGETRARLQVTLASDAGSLTPRQSRQLLRYIRQWRRSNREREEE